MDREELRQAVREVLEQMEANVRMADNLTTLNVLFKHEEDKF